MIDFSNKTKTKHPYIKLYDKPYIHALYMDTYGERYLFPTIHINYIYVSPPAKKKEKSSITCNSKLLHVLHLQSWYLTNFEIEINLRAAAQFPFLLASFSGT